MMTKKEELFFKFEELELGKIELLQDLFNYFSADELQGLYEHIKEEKEK